jgi:hypothetical protein
MSIKTSDIELKIAQQVVAKKPPQTLLPYLTVDLVKPRRHTESLLNNISPNISIRAQGRCGYILALCAFLICEKEHNQHGWV